MKSGAFFNIVLLHEGMVDKHGAPVTTSLTLIDLHDIARSARTYGVHSVYIAHPAPAMRKLARTLKRHWDGGFGASYNPNRREALGTVKIVNDLDEAIADIDARTGALPTLIATSAREGEARVHFPELRTQLEQCNTHMLMMLGTGWGMGPELLSRAQLFLEPVRGAGDYNHLSVRSACAIMLDRLLGSR